MPKGVLLLQDNAQPYATAATVTTIQKLKTEIINHPPYSLDLASSDCHVFGTLREAFQGQRFYSDDEHFWLQQQAKTLFSTMSI
jgi:hypothetical protein